MISTICPVFLRLGWRRGKNGRPKCFRITKNLQRTSSITWSLSKGPYWNMLPTIALYRHSKRAMLTSLCYRKGPYWGGEHPHERIQSMFNKTNSWFVDLRKDLLTSQFEYIYIYIYIYIYAHLQMHAIHNASCRIRPFGRKDAVMASGSFFLKRILCKSKCLICS